MRVCVCVCVYNALTRRSTCATHAQVMCGASALAAEKCKKVHTLTVLRSTTAGLSTRMHSATKFTDNVDLGYHSNGDGSELYRLLFDLGPDDLQRYEHLLDFNVGLVGGRAGLEHKLRNNVVTNLTVAQVGLRVVCFTRDCRSTSSSSGAWIGDKDEKKATRA